MAAVYSEKEILVFKGLEKLLEEGASMYAVKVQDIAAAAGIGKGTIYEYFESKEQIIARALIYFLDTSTQHAYTCVAQVEGFEQKWNILMDLCAQSIEQHATSFQIMMNGVDMKQICNYAKTYEPAIQTHLENVERLFGNVVKAGMAEGVLAVGHNMAYIQQATASALLGYSQFICKSGPNLTPQQLQQAKQNSYTLLVKMLG